MHTSSPGDEPAVTFPGGERRSALGLGTCRFGEQAAWRAAEVRTLRLALEIGYRVFDTAEMYGKGGAEAVLGEALDGALRAGVPREQCFVVSKVLPQHADADGVLTACERSLRALRLEQIDLYLLHWRGGVPLAETLRGFEALQRRGWIRHWGVSNFDVADQRELAALPRGDACAANQVYFSLTQRGVERDLLPWQVARQMPLMAYSPLDQGELSDHAVLREVAARHPGATPSQVALAWVLRHPGVMAIPKAGKEAHLRENWAAQQLQLGDEDLARLERSFAAPRGPVPLAMR